MTDGIVHPSFWELDQHCLGVEVEASAVLHLSECERCRRYVESYRPLTDVPAWVAGMSVQQVKAPRARVWAAGMLTAAAVCLALWWPRAQDNAYDGVKGAPSLGVHVQRAGVASLWDGTPLRSGDRIQLEVMPEEFDHISVFALGQADEPALRLYAGRVVPKVSAVLPKAWLLDDAEGPERLLVILARSEVSSQAAASLMHAHDPGEFWMVRLRLPKQRVAP